MYEGKQVVAVFGGSRCRPGDQEYDDSLRLGCMLAEQGYAVCTGGYYGVMEAISRGAQSVSFVDASRKATAMIR